MIQLQLWHQNIMEELGDSAILLLISISSGLEKGLKSKTLFFFFGNVGFCVKFCYLYHLSLLHQSVLSQTSCHAHPHLSPVWSVTAADTLLIKPCPHAPSPHSSLTLRVQSLSCCKSCCHGNFCLIFCFNNTFGFYLNSFSQPAFLGSIILNLHELSI